MLLVRPQHLDQTLALRQELIVGHDSNAVEPAIEPMQRTQPFVLPIVRTTYNDYCPRAIRNNLRMVTKTLSRLLVKHVQIPMTLTNRRGDVRGKVIVAMCLIPK